MQKSEELREVVGGGFIFGKKGPALNRSSRSERLVWGISVNISESCAGARKIQCASSGGRPTGAPLQSFFIENTAHCMGNRFEDDSQRALNESLPWVILLFVRHDVSDLIMFPQRRCGLNSAGARRIFPWGRHNLIFSLASKASRSLYPLYISVTLRQAQGDSCCCMH